MKNPLDLLKTTITRPDGTVVYEAFHTREQGFSLPCTILGSFEVKTVHCETGEPERLVESKL